MVGIASSRVFRHFTNLSETTEIRKFERALRMTIDQLQSVFIWIQFVFLSFTNSITRFFVNG